MIWKGIREVHLSNQSQIAIPKALGIAGQQFVNPRPYQVTP